jgi:hypothetical protein
MFVSESFQERFKIQSRFRIASESFLYILFASGYFQARFRLDSVSHTVCFILVEFFSTLISRFMFASGSSHVASGLFKCTSGSATFSLASCKLFVSGFRLVLGSLRACIFRARVFPQARGPGLLRARFRLASGSFRLFYAR